MNDFTDNQTISESTDAPVETTDSPDAFFSGKLAAAPVGEKFVVFFLNEQPFAVAASNIAEVSRPLTVALMPNAPEWLSGIANLRGEIITVLDLPHILLQQPLNASAKAKFVVLHTKNADASVAFTVDRLGEIIFITEDETENLFDEAAPFIKGKTNYGENDLLLIDAEKMLDSLTPG